MEKEQQKGHQRERRNLPERSRRLAASGLLAAGAVLMLLGIMRGEVGAVLTKAIRICMECIGIG